MSDTPRSTKLIVALDTQDTTQARQWAAELGGHVDMIKLGLEFAYAAGFDAVSEVAGAQPLFLDLKLHDIPNTVASAVRSLSRLRPRLLTLHASGGRAMMQAGCAGRLTPRAERAVATIWGASSPASAYWACWLLWSIKRSGRVMGRKRT